MATKGSPTGPDLVMSCSRKWSIVATSGGSSILGDRKGLWIERSEDRSDRRKVLMESLILAQDERWRRA
jgi:hypothetical protein